MKAFRFFLPRIEYILFAAIFWGIVANGPKILNFDGDLPRHILTGNLILRTWKVPTTDIFSFRTVGYPSFPHEWFSQVLFAAVYDWLGLNGIVLLTALVIMLTWWIVYSQAIRQCKSIFSSLIFVALAIAAAQIHILPRPHIFTYLLTAIWISVLESVQQRKKRLWWILPFLMLVWVNMHGMFVLGVFILGIYLLGDFLDHPSKAWFTSRETKSLLLGSCLSIVMTFFSPSGPKIWEAVTALGSNTYITAKIPEYQSANFHLPETWPFIIILLLTMIGLGRSEKKVSWIPILLLVSFTGMALYTSRMIPLFAIVISPIAARISAEWIKNEYAQNHPRLVVLEANISKTNSSSNGSIWIFAVILVTALFLESGKTVDPHGQGNMFDPHFFPVDAVSWLQTHPPVGHVFNEFDWGGYLLLKLWPAQQIFMDGHTHIYGEALTREYEQVIALRSGWEEILKKYDVKWVIMRQDAPLTKALSGQDNWSVAYQDPTTVILVHK